MLGGIYQSAAILILLVVFYGVDVWLMHRYDPLRAEGSCRAWGYTVMASCAAVLLILQPVVWPGLGLHISGRWALVIQVGGLVLTLTALALHWWARLCLGQFYGEREEVQAGQYLVESGPYAYIRHPIYTSYFLFTIGLLLINPSLFTLAAVMYAFVDFSQAVRREEKLLSEKLPGYAEYMARTPRFLPRLHKPAKPAGGN